MANGTGSILKLNPHGGTSITFQVSRAVPQGDETYVLFVDLGELRLNESERIQWDYDEGRSGGRAIDQKGGLVSAVFSVLVAATSVSARIDAYNTLLAAVTNRRGGTLEYVPEGLSSSTFYHYQSSAAPALRQSVANRWDRARRSDGMYELELDVELMTQPLATGDPDPDTVINLIDSGQADQTVVTGEGTYAEVGLTERIAIDNLSGTEPALTRIIAYGADSQDVGRVIAFRKSGAGKDEAHVLDAKAEGTIIGSSTQYWSTPANAARVDNYYRRINPPEDANGIEYGIRFTLENPARWEGVFAVFMIGKDGSGAGAWKHHVEMEMDGVVVQESSEYQSRLYGNWQLIYGGELVLPPTTQSLVAKGDGYGADVHIDWYAQRPFGTGDMCFDALVLVQVEDADGQGSVVDVVSDGDDRIAATERLLIDGFVGEYGAPVEGAHILSSGDLAYKRSLSVAPRGTFLTLDPDQEHTVRVLSERPVATPFVDNLDVYKANYWRQLATFETDSLTSEESIEGWALSTAVSFNSEFSIEGGIVISEGLTFGQLKVSQDTDNPSYARVERDVQMDLSGDGRFETDDFLVYSRYLLNPSSPYAIPLTHARVGFIDADGQSAYDNMLWWDGLISSGAKTELVKRSALSSADLVNWADIRKMYIEFGAEADEGCLNATLLVDDIAVIKADPNNADQPNCTGGKWEFLTGENWMLEEDLTNFYYRYYHRASLTSYGATVGERRNPGVTLALRGHSYYEKAMLNEDVPTRFRYQVRLTTIGPYGKSGLWWCGDSDFLTDSENGYMLSTDWSSNISDERWRGVMVLEEYTAGISGRPASYSSMELEKTIWAYSEEPVLYGIEVNRTTGETKIYVAPESETDTDADLWQSSHVMWSYTDTTHTSRTKVGLYGTSGCNMRADKIVIFDNEDRIYTDDDLDVAIQGQYRTITPLRG